MTVATFDIPFGLDATIVDVRDSYSAHRSEGVVQVGRVNARGMRQYRIHRTDGRPGDAWRLRYLWDLTSGVLDMDFTDPETSDSIRVTFIREPTIRQLGPGLFEIDVEFEEVL